ncbi:MAG: tripartite tricarboxylate transporter TctB family protein [Burkholderiaceae bacterium]
MSLKWGDKVFEALIGAGFVVAGAAMAWQTFLIDADAGYAGIGPRFFPLAIAAGLAVCGLLLILQAALGGYHKLELDTAGPRLDRTSLSGLMWIVGGLLFQLLAISILGFVPTSAVLFMCVARAFGVTGWLKSLAIGVVLALVIWAIFTQLLGVSLQGFLRA